MYNSNANDAARTTGFYASLKVEGSALVSEDRDRENRGPWRISASIKSRRGPGAQFNPVQAHS